MAFGKYFTDHMLKIAYHKRLGGWQKPEITPMETLNLHPAAKVFHYAVEVSCGTVTGLPACAQYKLVGMLIGAIV